MRTKSQTNPSKDSLKVEACIFNPADHDVCFYFFLFFFLVKKDLNSDAPITFKARFNTLQSFKAGESIRYTAQLFAENQTQYYLSIDQCSVLLDEKGAKTRNISFIEEG